MLPIRRGFNPLRCHVNQLVRLTPAYTPRGNFITIGRQTSGSFLSNGAFFSSSSFSQKKLEGERVEDLNQASSSDQRSWKRTLLFAAGIGTTAIALYNRKKLPFWSAELSEISLEDNGSPSNEIEFKSTDNIERLKKAEIIDTIERFIEKTSSQPISTIEIDKKHNLLLFHKLLEAMNKGEALKLSSRKNPISSWGSWYNASSTEEHFIFMYLLLCEAKNFFNSDIDIRPIETYSLESLKEDYFFVANTDPQRFSNGTIVSLLDTSIWYSTEHVFAHINIEKLFEAICRKFNIFDLESAEDILSFLFHIQYTMEEPVTMVLPLQRKCLFYCFLKAYHQLKNGDQSSAEFFDDDVASIYYGFFKTIFERPIVTDKYSRHQITKKYENMLNRIKQSPFSGNIENFSHPEKLLEFLGRLSYNALTHHKFPSRLFLKEDDPYLKFALDTIEKVPLNQWENKHLIIYKLLRDFTERNERVQFLDIIINSQCESETRDFVRLLREALLANTPEEQKVILQSIEKNKSFSFYQETFLQKNRGQNPFLPGAV
jgi:hypothetical protein